MANMAGPPLLRPFNPNERRPNPDGSYSTEVTTTWQLPDGQWTNVPSLWMGPNGPVQFNPDDEDSIMTSMRNLEQINGPSFQRFPDVQSAEAAAQSRSQAGGAGMGKMVTLEINGRDVEVDDSFLRMTPEQQNATVDEIAQSLGGQAQQQAEQPQSSQMQQGLSELSAITQNPARAQYDALPEWQKPLVAASDTVQLAANGATFGFGDKIAAGMRAPFTDKSYEEELAAQRGLTQGARNRAGSAGVAAEVAGGVAAPLALANKGLTLAGRGGTAAMTGAKGLAARTGLMGLEGAGYGTLSAAGNDQDLATGAGMGALGGVGGNLIGEGASALVGKVAGAFNPKAPQLSVDDLKSMSNAAYKNADAAGVVFNKTGIDRLTRNVVDDLTTHGFDPANEPGAMAVLKRLQAMRGGNVTFKGLDTLRKVASNGFVPGNQSNNKVLTQIIGRIDELVNTADPATVMMGNPKAGAAAIQEARSLWGRARKLETVEGLMDRAALNAGSSGSGGNVENATRQQLKRILTSETTGRGFSAAEKEATRKAVMGTKTQNALRLAGKISPQGNGLMAALGLGGAVAAPQVAIPAMVMGYGAKKTAEHLSRKSVAELVNLISRGGVPAPIVQNTIQLLAKSKREALTRALMAFGVAYSTQAARAETPDKQRNP